MIKEIYIKAKVEYTRGKTSFISDSVCPVYYKVPKELRNLSEKKLLAEYDFLTLEKVQEFFNAGSFPGTVKSFKLIYVQRKGKFVNGEYYAHEYDRYTNGKARKLTWSDGTVEYEVHCLNRGLSVLDGIWEEYSNNGCGDTFEPFEKGLE